MLPRIREALCMNAPMTSKKPPIFVVGCPRSGTTLLYHMLLSAGDFAIYRAETHVFNVLVPHFGDLGRLEGRTRLVDEWLKTDYFRATGVSAEVLRARILEQCESGGDFLRIVMESVAEKQGVNRWSECTPEHVLHLKEIKREIPQAKVIHIIRDGRDVAASLDKQGWIRPLPWDKRDSLLVSGLYWQWIVESGRRLGRKIVPDYMEVNFERLVANPRDELPAIADFVEQKLDYDEILRAGVGSVSRPNTSFPGQPKETAFSPVGRWKDRTEAEIAELESLIGPLLEDLGYSLVSPKKATQDLRLRRMQASYRTMFESKHWLKSRTWFGRLSSPSVLHERILDN
jgi:hypothetical protein